MRIAFFLPHFLWDCVDDFLGAFRKATAPLQVGLWVLCFECPSADKRSRLLQGLDDVLSAPKTKLKTLESLIGRLL